MIIKNRLQYYTVILVFEDQFQNKHERYFQVAAYNYNDAKIKAKKANKKGLVFKLKTVK